MIATIKKYLIIAFITAFVLVVGLLYYYYNQNAKNKAESKEKTTILDTKEKLYKNDSLENASRVYVWTRKYSDLERAHKIAIQDRSEYEQKLSRAYDAIALTEEKGKKVKEYYESLLSSRDTFYQPMPADCYLKPIKSKYINIDFLYQDSIVGIAYAYHTGQNIVVPLYPKLKKNGKSHWFLPHAGWLWGWDAGQSIWTVEDKNANITNQVSIEFKK